MGQDDQQPICCGKCGILISQIEPDETSEYKTLHWGQYIDYWSLELHCWEKESGDYHQPENYSICTKCKKEICKPLTSDKRVG